MTNTSQHRKSAADLMAMPLGQLHEIPGCQCPEHQPASVKVDQLTVSLNYDAARDLHVVAVCGCRMVALADHGQADGVYCFLASLPADLLGRLWSYAITCEPVTLADHLAAGIDAILGG